MKRGRKCVYIMPDPISYYCSRKMKKQGIRGLCPTSCNGVQSINSFVRPLCARGNISLLQSLKIRWSVDFLYGFEAPNARKRSQDPFDWFMNGWIWICIKAQANFFQLKIWSHSFNQYTNYHSDPSEIRRRTWFSEDGRSQLLKSSAGLCFLLKIITDAKT